MDVYSNETSMGLVITRLDIRPVPGMEVPTAGITSTVIRNIRIPEIRSRLIDEIEDALARFEDAAPQLGESTAAYRFVQEEIENLQSRHDAATHRSTPRRATYVKQHTWAGEARQVLAAAETARETRKAFNPILQKRWTLGFEGVKTKVRRLKGRGYIKGRAPNFIEGPELKKWAHTTTTKDG